MDNIQFTIRIVNTHAVHARGIIKLKAVAQNSLLILDFSSHIICSFQERFVISIIVCIVVCHACIIY